MSSLFELARDGESDLVELPEPVKIDNKSENELNLLGTNDDREAIGLWLSRYEKKTHTFKTYIKESDRFFLWLKFTKQELKAIGKQQLDDYISFIQNPMPTDLWCNPVAGGKNGRRGSKGWKPFKAGLTQKSVQHSLTIIGSLFGFLVDAGFLNRNPVKLINTNQKNNHDFRQYEILERILSPDEWQMILNAVDEIESRDEKIRARFIISMLFYTGVRISELESLQWNNFQKTNTGWSLFVVGKGDKPRDIAVEDLIYEVISYRKHLGLPAFPKGEEENVIRSLDGNTSISSSQIFKIIKGIGCLAAKKEGVDSYTAKRLKAFSPHWIRHLCPSLLAQEGVDSRYIQQMLGHSSSQTTDIYVHLFDAGRRDAVKKLKL